MVKEPNTDGGVGSVPPRTVLGRRPVPFEIRPTTVGTDQLLSLGVDTHAAREAVIFGCMAAVCVLVLVSTLVAGMAPPFPSRGWWELASVTCATFAALVYYVNRYLRHRRRTLFVQFTKVPDEVAVLEGSRASTARVIARAHTPDVRIEVREISVSVQYRGSGAWSGVCALLNVDGQFVPLACVKNLQEMDAYLTRLPTRLRWVKCEARPKFEAHGNLRLAGSRSSV